jgi:hypothetical protein
MRTLADVEKELKELRRRVHELEGNPVNENQAAVDELVGDGTSTAAGRGGFSAACDEAREERERRAFDKAREDLLADPTVVDSPDGRSRFLASRSGTKYYSSLRHEVESLHALRHPRSEGDDSPTEQNTAFVQRTRPF